MTDIALGTVLAGAVPRLIDEWQIEPAIWNHIRRAIDDRAQPGQFILTGSAVPADDITRHTGAARMTRLRMRPMSLHETGHSTGTISLKALLASSFGPCSDPGLTIQDVATRVAVGGWPSHQVLTHPQALQAMRGYLDEIRRVDIDRVDNVRRDPDRVGRLLASLARNVATSVSISALARDTGGTDGPLKDDTVREYLAALDRLMIIEDQPAWAPHLRSRSILRTAPKRHFVDPALAVAALRATPVRLLHEIEWFGFLFESLVVRDLRIYAQANDAMVRHYRDNTGLEVDAIVETAAGVWAASHSRRHRRGGLWLRAPRRGGGHPHRRIGAVSEMGCSRPVLHRARRCGVGRLVGVRYLTSTTIATRLASICATIAMVASRSPRPKSSGFTGTTTVAPARGFGSFGKIHRILRRVSTFPFG